MENETANVVKEKSQTFAEKRDHAKTIDILTVANSLGIEIQKKGRTTTGVEHDSLVFDTNKNRFHWFSQDLGGDVISFVQTFTDMDFKQAVDYLNSEDLSQATVQITEPVRKPFSYYLKDQEDFSEAYNYLVNDRKLNPTLIEKLFREGLLVQSEYMPFFPKDRTPYPCIVAKWERRGEIVGGTIQGLIDDPTAFGKRGRDKRIMANVESNFGWNYSIGTPRKMIVAESFIDLLSYWTLHPDLNDCMFVDIEGLKENSVSEFLQYLYNDKGGNLDNGMVIAVDNDAAGQRFVDKLSVYRFSERENYELAQPYNNAISGTNMLAYQRIGEKYQVDPLAIASVHKAFTNGSDTNELANPWRNDQFFGKVLKPKERPTPIDVPGACEAAAAALQKVKRADQTYDFAKMIEDGPGTEHPRMVEKIERFYRLYQEQGVDLREHFPKDWNDVLKASFSPERERNQEVDQTKMEMEKEKALQGEKSLPERYYRVEFNESNEQMGIPDFSGSIITPELIEKMKTIDQQEKQRGEGYSKVFFELVEGGQVVDKIRMDLGDGLVANDAIYNTLLKGIEPETKGRPAITITSQTKELQAENILSIQIEGKELATIATVSREKAIEILTNTQQADYTGLSILLPGRMGREKAAVASFGQLVSVLHQRYPELVQMPDEVIRGDREEPEVASPSDETKKNAVVVIEQNQKDQIISKLNREVAAFEAEILDKTPSEILALSPQIALRRDLSHALTEWLNAQQTLDEWGERLIVALEKQESVIDQLAPVMLERQSYLYNPELFSAEMPKVFVEKLPEPVGPGFVLAPGVKEEIDQAIALLAIETNQDLSNPIIAKRVNLEVNYFRDLLVDHGLIEKAEKGLILSSQAKESTYQSVISTVLQPNDPAAVIQSIADYQKELVKENERVPGNLQGDLKDFQSWLHNYQGVTTDYLPITEVDALVVSEGKLEYPPANTWFDSLPDYLATQKDFPFGQTAAFQEAETFLEHLHDPDCDLVVKKLQLENYLEHFAELRGNELLPVGINQLLSDSLVKWAVVQNGEILALSSEEASKNPEAFAAIMPTFEMSARDHFDLNFSTSTYLQQKFSEGVKELQLEANKAELQDQLANLVEWNERYKGPDTGYTPYTEIESLEVALNKNDDYVIRDTLNGTFHREYDSIQSYLNSYEGSVWSETSSYESAQRYLDYRKDPLRKDYEIMVQNFTRKKESLLAGEAIAEEYKYRQELWESLYVMPIEKMPVIDTKKVIYYQDPVRNDNPLFFDDVRQAKIFIEKSVAEKFGVKEQEQEARKTRGGFFRRSFNSLDDSVPQTGEPEKIDSKKRRQADVPLKKEKESITSSNYQSPKRAGRIHQKKAAVTSKELLAQAKNDIREFMDSEKYKTYLQTMSKFHNYSWANIVLIHDQMPNASLVAGFQTWKKQHQRYVKKGESGIKILAPVTYEKEKEVEKIVDGKKQKETETVTYRSFKTVTVFDVSQTNGEPLPTLTKELTGSVEDYARLFEAIAATTDYQIKFETPNGEAKGTCNFVERVIRIRPEMSEVQTVKTLIHEVTHSLLHEPDKQEGKTKRTLEVEAESVAYAVSSYLGLDTSEYSFAYLASWSSTKDLKELTQSFKVIQDQTDKMIENITQNLETLEKERNVEKQLEGKLKGAREKSGVINEQIKKSQGKGRRRVQTKPPKER